MSSVFSSNETDCIERTVESRSPGIVEKDIWNEHRLFDCKEWIKEHSFTRFPDSLLPYSTTVVHDLEKIGNVELCILGDTSYGSCCVDEVAASHFFPEAIMHFGHACLSKVTNYPVFYVFPSLPIDVPKFKQRLYETMLDGSKKIIIFYSDEYFYEMDKIRSIVRDNDRIKIAEFAIDSSADFLCWKMPEPNLKDCVCIFLGTENQSFFNLTVSVRANKWICYDPQTDELKEVLSPLNTNWMRRRHFSIEKCKDALSLGIIVGTLTASGYLTIVERIKELAHLHGTRTYLLSVGKVNPAKVANFNEIDCFVYVGCSENRIYLSRDFYKPILSVFEVEIALNPIWKERYPEMYSVDFRELLPSGQHYCDISKATLSDVYDVSLVTGKIRSSATPPSKISDGIVEKKTNQMLESSSSQTFQMRSWTGLSTNFAIQDPAKIVEGRSGLPVKYSESAE